MQINCMDNKDNNQLSVSRFFFFQKLDHMHLIVILLYFLVANSFKCSKDKGNFYEKFK